MISKNTEHLISIAVTDNESLTEALPRIEAFVSKYFTFYEILIVKSCSTINGTQHAAQEIHAVKNGRCILMNYPVTREQVLQVAIEKSIGDFIVFVEPKVDNLELIPELIKQAAEGNDYVAVEYTSSQNSKLYLFAAWLFYAFVYAVTGSRVPEYTSCFSCINRKLASALQEENRCMYIKLFARQFGYSVRTIPTQQLAPRLSFSLLLNRLRTALDIISDSSARLISFAAMLALGGCIANVLYLMYVAAVYLFVSDVQVGWTTTSLLLASMFAMIFFVLFAIGMSCSSILKHNSRYKQNMIAQEISSSDNLFEFNELNIEGV